MEQHKFANVMLGKNVAECVQERNHVWVVWIKRIIIGLGKFANLVLVETLYKFRLVSNHKNTIADTKHVLV